LLQLQDKNVRVGQALKIGCTLWEKANACIPGQQHAQESRASLSSSEKPIPQKKPAGRHSRRASVNLTELFSPQNLTKRSAFALAMAAAESATLRTTHSFSQALDDFVFMGGFQS
jgi:hypothetical protein